MNDLVAQQTASVLSVIEKIASNPDADIDKLQKMMDMQERIMDKNAEAAFNQAMVSALSEIPSFEEDTQGHNFKYASFESINKEVKPILAKHGLFVNFTTNFQDGGVMVTAIITHKDGHREQSTGLYPFDKSGSKNDIQAVGSAISYGKRYQQNALLNITTHGEDDDGFASQKKIDSNQINELNRGLLLCKETYHGVCEYIGVSKLSEIPTDKYSEAHQFISNIIASQKHGGQSSE